MGKGLSHSTHPGSFLISAGDPDAISWCCCWCSIFFTIPFYILRPHTLGFLFFSFSVITTHKNKLFSSAFPSCTSSNIDLGLAQIFEEWEESVRRWGSVRNVYPTRKRCTLNSSSFIAQYYSLAKLIFYFPSIRTVLKSVRRFIPTLIQIIFLLKLYFFFRRSKTRLRKNQPQNRVNAFLIMDYFPNLHRFYVYAGMDYINDWILFLFLLFYAFAFFFWGGFIKNQSMKHLVDRL